MIEIAGKFVPAPPERGRAARNKTILFKTKGKKGGKAKIPSPDPLLK